jgi:YD repeat-containing protein
MKIISAVLFLLVHSVLSAQSTEYNILDRDSFPPFVKTVTLIGRMNPEEQKDTISQRYIELDTSGAWKVLVDVYSDGSMSRDSVSWDRQKRIRTTTKTNEFEPGKVVVTYNADGTVRSVSNEPGQRDPQRTEFEYDALRRVTKKTLTFVESLTVEEYTYDTKGRMLSRKRSSGSVHSKKLQLDYEEKYEYQQQGDDYVMYALHYGAKDAVRIRDTVFFMFNDRHLLENKVEVMDNHTWDRLTVYEYDDLGRVTHLQVQSMEKGEEHITNTSIEYDSLGYYKVYVEEESDGTGYSNRWTTHYNEHGLPVDALFTTPAAIFYYEWKYEYR